ncbi:hypothetical protein NB706_003463 [Xanthomonas sacchari]|nr:hypothetical protein [Xanthomonas sacchari]
MADRRVGGAHPRQQLRGQFGGGGRIHRHHHHAPPRRAHHDAGRFRVPADVEFAPRRIDELARELRRRDAVAALPRIEAAAHVDQLLGQRGEVGIEPLRQGQIGQRPGGDDADLAGELAHLADHEQGGRLAGCLHHGGIAQRQVRDHVVRVVARCALHGVVLDPLPGPGALPQQLAVQRFPAFGGHLAVEQREHRAGQHRHFATPGDLEQAPGMRQRFVAPDVAADHRDAQHLHLGRLQQQQLRRGEAVDVVFEDDPAARGGGAAGGSDWHEAGQWWQKGNDRRVGCDRRGTTRHVERKRLRRAARALG